MAGGALPDRPGPARLRDRPSGGRVALRAPRGPGPAHAAGDHPAGRADRPPIERAGAVSGTTAAPMIVRSTSPARASHRTHRPVGERMDPGGRPGSHERKAVTADQNGGIEVRDLPDRADRGPPIPGRVPGRAGEALALLQEARPGIDLQGQDGVATEDDPVARPDVGNVSRLSLI